MGVLKEIMVENVLDGKTSKNPYSEGMRQVMNWNSKNNSIHNAFQFLKNINVFIIAIIKEYITLK